MNKLKVPIFFFIFVLLVDLFYLFSFLPCFVECNFFRSMHLDIILFGSVIFTSVVFVLTVKTSVNIYTRFYFLGRMFFFLLHGIYKSLKSWELLPMCVMNIVKFSNDCDVFILAKNVTELHMLQL